MTQERHTLTLDVTIKNSTADFPNYLESIANADVAGLQKAQQSYGDSWKKRGGVGAFMMLARKWDRLENALRPAGEGLASDRAKMVKPTEPGGIVFHEHCVPWDIFQAAKIDKRSEGIIDDIRDLRRYLILVLAEQMATAQVGNQSYTFHLQAVADDLVKRTRDTASPSRFGGVYEFLLLADQWDNLEADISASFYDIFQRHSSRIRPVAVALLRIEAMLISRGTIHGAHRDNAA